MALPTRQRDAFEAGCPRGFVLVKHPASPEEVVRTALPFAKHSDLQRSDAARPPVLVEELVKPRTGLSETCSQDGGHLSRHTELVIMGSKRTLIDQLRERQEAGAADGSSEWVAHAGGRDSLAIFDIRCHLRDYAIPIAIISEGFSRNFHEHSRSSLGSNGQLLKHVALRARGPALRRLCAIS